MIRTVLVDDEPDAIEVLRTLLEKNFPTIEVISTFTRPEQALKAIPKLHPDLVFLDIEMPGLNGLEMIDALQDPEIFFVFFTAHEKYALHALKKDVVDYLMKPIDHEELLETVKKVQVRMEANQRPDYRALLADFFRSERIRIPTGKGWKFLQISDIVYIRAQRNYSEIALQDDTKLVVIKLLKEFEEELAPSGFFRPHNSYLVNTKHVQEYVRSEGGWLIMTNGAEISVSKRYRQSLNDLFG